MEGQPIEATERVTSWTTQLLSLLEEQLEEAVDAVLASQDEGEAAASAECFSGTEEEKEEEEEEGGGGGGGGGGEEEEERSSCKVSRPSRQVAVFNGVMKLDKHFPGKVCKHIPVKTRNTTSLWIKRRATRFDEELKKLKTGVIKMGWRVMRSMDHPAFAKLKSAAEGGGDARSCVKKKAKIEKLKLECGTVCNVLDSGEVEVLWDWDKRREVCRFGKIVQQKKEENQAPTSLPSEGSSGDGNSVSGSIYSVSTSGDTEGGDASISEENEDDGNSAHANDSLPANIGIAVNGGRDGDDSEAGEGVPRNVNFNRQIRVLTNESKTLRLSTSKKVYDIVIIDEEAAGLIYHKGRMASSNDESGNDPWSVIKLQINKRGTVGFAASQGGANRWIGLNGISKIPSGEWTHVAVATDEANCTLFVNGCQEAKEKIPSSMSCGLKFGSKNKEAVIESSHPYLNSTDQCWTVNVDGATAYSISFDAKSSTERTFDFVKFWKDDTRLERFGEEKYCGGMDGTEHNWPGVDGKDPLVINAEAFVVQFKTDASNTDWGWKLYATPIFDGDDDESATASSEASANDADGEIGGTSSGDLLDNERGGEDDGLLRENRQEENPPILNEDGDNNPDLPNNGSPFYFGNLPRECLPLGMADRGFPALSFDGFVSKMELYTTCLKPSEVAQLQSQRPVMSPIVVESNLCLDVLSMLMRCARSGVMSTSAALITPSVLKALIILTRLGDVDAKIAATRVLQFIMPLATTEVVDSQHKSFQSYGSVLQGDTYVTQLILEIGESCNPFYVDTGAAGINGWDHSRREKSALCNEQVKLVRALMGNSDFATQIVQVICRAIEGYSSLSTLLLQIRKKEVDAAIVIPDGDDIDMRAVKVMSAILEVIGGGFCENVIGTSGLCRVKSSDSAVREVVVVGECRPPPKRLISQMEEPEKRIWEECDNYGDALIVAYLGEATGDPGQGLIANSCSIGIVPVGSVVVGEEIDAERHDFTDSFNDALLSEESMGRLLVELFKELLNTDVVSGGREALDIVSYEKDEEVVVESEHPYVEDTDYHGTLFCKAITFMGAEKMEICFADECYTGNPESYVVFWKDDTKSAKWGESKYYGGPNSGNWPGSCGRPPLVIDAKSCYLEFHACITDGDSDEWGFKLTAKVGRAHDWANKLFWPSPPLPPALTCLPEYTISPNSNVPPPPAPPGRPIRSPRSTHRPYHLPWRSHF